MTAGQEVVRAEEQFYAALGALMLGNTDPMKAALSHASDATAFLGWGSYERGWPQIEERWEWVRSRFTGPGSNGQGPVAETLSRVVTSDLAYTIAIERGVVRLVGHDEPVSMTLRVTHIYRREAEGWKMTHRHADALRERQ